MLTHKSLSLLYDAITATVSLLDFITDVIVLMQYYNQQRMPFFYASLTILIVAQLSYSTAFWFRFAGSFNSILLVMIVFICALLIAPILSFVFYLIGNDDSRLYRSLYALFSGSAVPNTQNTSFPTNSQPTALREWAESKMMKHIGFIIEALTEAFPQSILQLIAIVHYNDNNYVAMFSILLSMLSIATKSFVLSVLVSYNWRSAFFNWISCITDIFGIFFIVSFAFYNPDHLDENDTNPFHMIQLMWLYSIFITVAPFVTNAGIGWGVKQIQNLAGSDGGWTILVVIICIVGICVASMLFSISCFVLWTAAIHSNGLHYRLRRCTHSAHIYVELVSFIQNAKRIHAVDANIDFNFALSKTQHQVIRVCCVNYIYLRNVSSNITMQSFRSNLEQRSIIQKDADYPYTQVTLNSLRNSDRNIIRNWLSAYEKARNKINTFLRHEWLRSSRLTIIYFLGPLYLIGRILHAIFIVLVFCYLAFGHNVYIFVDIPLFQSIMFMTYSLLLLSWALVLRTVLREQYYASFILPDKDCFEDIKAHHSNWASEAKEYCDALISYPMAKRYCTILFGADTSNIIMEFCGDKTCA